MKKVFVLAAFLAVLAGCRSLAPVYNIPLKTVFVPPGSTLRGAILAAGSSRGWNMRAVKPGVIEGNITTQAVAASIRINYTDENYSITYMDSRGFSYNPQKQKIHPRYNNWINNLDKSILQELKKNEVRRLRLENQEIK